MLDELAKIENGDCPGSVEDIQDKWPQWRREGVSASADGVFFFLAGDSYLWLNGMYAGKVGDSYRLVSTRPYSTPISKDEFLSIQAAARDTETASAVGPSARDHNPCEIVAVRNDGRLTIHATRQVVNHDAKGRETVGGFEQLRRLIEPGWGPDSEDE
jgi:hypothetical protein